MRDFTQLDPAQLTATILGKAADTLGSLVPEPMTEAQTVQDQGPESSDVMTTLMTAIMGRHGQETADVGVPQGINYELNTVYG